MFLLYSCKLLPFPDIHYDSSGLDNIIPGAAWPRQIGLQIVTVYNWLLVVFLNIFSKNPSFWK